ncbi:hypothetical protein RPB_3042 [Rhodopseudomonas palustris HaA2]|uniref:Uncharacterized protein n=2 Tax=Rhodopseudomonas palustris TaxID=1076 RepID=Q2IVL6_RHOP2|nr:hypothetical protein RPB_3042 [Rhodopseudomonas palustris HaA2]
MHSPPPHDPKPLHQRPPERAGEWRERTEERAPTAERERLIKQARELDTAANIQGWLSSPELEPPK